MTEPKEQNRTEAEDSGREQTSGRVMLEGRNGFPVFLSESQAAAYLTGQRKAKRGAEIKDRERKVSALLSLLRGEKP